MCFSALVRARLEELEAELGAEAVTGLWSQLYETDREDPGKIKFVAGGEGRLYPMYMGPVIRAEGDTLVVEPMRYSAWVPRGMEGRRYTSYNARRDNLHSSFWEDAAGCGHGFVILTAFFEWVAVRDLLQAGEVSAEEVEARFALQSAERREKMLAAGKAYRPTKTEEKKALERNIVVEFREENHQQLLVPVIYNQDKVGNSPFKGFAMVTDSPTEEIRRAGHDRCPVILTREAIDHWLYPEGLSLPELDDILGQKMRPVFRHRLDTAS